MHINLSLHFNILQAYLNVTLAFLWQGVNHVATTNVPVEIVSNSSHHSLLDILSKTVPRLRRMTA